MTRSLWIVPSRARPTRLHAMLTAGLRLDPDADFAVCLDEDDPTLAGYQMIRAGLGKRWPGRIIWQTGPRGTMPSWTNKVAGSSVAAAYPALGSIGDDHIPKTEGWAAALAAALPGAGLTFGDDLHQHGDLPTCWLESRVVIGALGWMCLPGLTHFFADTVVGALGARYVPEVVVEHRHPVWGTAPQDGTYADASPSYIADQAVFEAWSFGQANDDRLVVARAVKEEETRWTGM